MRCAAEVRSVVVHRKSIQRSSKYISPITSSRASLNRDEPIREVNGGVKSSSLLPDPPKIVALWAARDSCFTHGTEDADVGDGASCTPTEHEAARLTHDEARDASEVGMRTEMGVVGCVDRSSGELDFGEFPAPPTSRISSACRRQRLVQSDAASSPTNTMWSCRR